jgi:hypothetical protein
MAQTWRIGDTRYRHPERTVAVASESQLAAAKRKYADQHRIAVLSVWVEKPPK